MNFDRGLVDISLSLIPGSGGGITLVSSLPFEARGRVSNRIYGAGMGENVRIFLSAGDTVFSVDLSDNSIQQFSGQGQLWIIPADITTSSGGNRNTTGKIENAWVVSDRGRVTLVDGNMEPVQGFPVITGLRLSSPPVSYNGILYICDEDGRVHTINESGRQTVWETSFIAALRSPPSFLTFTSRSGGRNNERNYAAVYPKSFLGEIWLLDTDGKALPNWPVPVSAAVFGGETSGIAFGSPLLFARDNSVHVAFVTQDGELSVYGENASLVPPFPLNLAGVFYLQPVFDGEYLWLVSAGGILFRISFEGEVLYQHIAGLSVMEEGYITVFDCDGDGIPEIFITGEGNVLHAYTRNFRSLEGFPLPVWGMPYFAAAQGSRKPEIFGMGMDRQLYRWQFR